VREEKNAEIFPKHFFWGASTSAHQVEGRNQNQWTVWELENAAQQAQTAHLRLSWMPSWDQFKDQAEEPSNYVSGEGVDHFNRYKEDFAIIKQLNMNAFRFSVEWSRIEPLEGQWDEQAIEHYQKYIKELRRMKIEPFFNIWHWTLPVWFAEKGGFEKKENLEYWNRFVKKIADDLMFDVEYVITLNEPNVDATFSYLLNLHPRNNEQRSNQITPAVWTSWKFVQVYWNLMRAHRSAYKILKDNKPTLNVGIATQLANIQAKRPHNYLDQITTQVMRYFWNWWFLNKVKRQLDFVGVNYYFSDYYTGLGKRRNPKVPTNDMGWYMEPEGIYPLLLRVWARYKKPVFVTESGLADANDEYRQWWIEESIVSMEKALSEGVDLRGYFYWSLLDNFEWQDGWWPQFGLVHVDRKKGMKRTIRPSAKWFGDWLSRIR